MPTYEVNSPDGKTYKVNAPEGSTEQDAISYVQREFYGPKEVSMPANKEGFGEALNREVRDIPRQLGLTARYGIEGVGGTLDMLASPFRAGLNAILPNKPGGGPAIQGNTGEAIANAIGLPSPRTKIENISSEISKMLAGGAGLLGASRIASSLPGITGKVAGLLAQNPAQQLQSAVGAGAAGGYVKETGGNPLSQTLAAVAGGVAAPLGMSAVKAIPQAAKGAVEFLAPGMAAKPQNLDQVDITISNLLKPSGVAIGDLSASVRNQLREDVASAMKSGGQLDYAALRRLADYRMTGATPTRATVTLDPADITRQKNAAKFGINSADPKLQQLGQIENANNRALIGRMNDLGGTPEDSIAAAGKVMGVLDRQNTAAKKNISDLYTAAREAAGRDIPLDRESFVLDAYGRLAKENKGAFLPAEVQRLLESIRAGTIKVGDQAMPTPFTIDTIDNLKTVLSNAAMSKDGNTRSAVRLVRDALDDIKVAPQGRNVGGNQVADPALLEQMQNRATGMSKEALDAFDAARKANRQWMSIVDRVPALQAVREGVEPDKFVNDFIIGSGTKASVMDAAKLKSMVSNSPEAMQAIRGQIISHLKSKALGGASDEVGNISQSNLNRAMQSIGDRKLALFFSKGEVEQIKAIARVASYEQVQPRGSAVNNSNTAGAALATLFDKLANSPLLGKIPLAPQIAGNVSASLTARKALNAPSATVIPKQSMGASPFLLPALAGSGLLAE